MRMMVMKGFLPLFLLSGFFLAAPIIHYYAAVDYTSTATRGGVIAVASVVGLAIVSINDIVALFNFVLFFHTGLEVKVLDILQTFANDSTTSDGDMALAWVGFAVIIVHLLPFFLCDKRMLLVLLGVVGTAPAHRCRGRGRWPRRPRRGTRPTGGSGRPLRASRAARAPSPTCR